MANAEVRINSIFDGILVEGKALAGGDQIKLTDNSGLVEFTLIRGTKVSVAIIGTDVVREITVPTTTTIKTFNLLDPDISTGDDIFKVQVPDIIVAERRSL